MSGFSGQGKILVGPRLVSGHPGLMRWIGNASQAKLTLEEDAEERNESYSGNRLPNRRLTRTRKGTLTLVFDEYSTDNIALAKLATVTAVASGSAVVGYTFPTGAKVGSFLMAPGAKNLSAVAIKDSAGSPATLVAGTDYNLNAFAGSVELLNLGSYVQPFKMDYTPGAFVKIGALNQPTTEMFVQFDGINTDTGEKIVADIYRVRFKPVKDMDLIGEGYEDFELEGTVLADLTRQYNSADGQLYNIAKPA